MYQLMIIPGQHKPGQLYTFLQPVMTELFALATDGMEVPTIEGESIYAKVHLLLFTGDTLAVADLINHRGHSHKYGCRICTIAGVYNGGTYFHGKASSQARRSVESYRTQNETVSNGENK
jgi:hypothetical protein